MDAGVSVASGDVLDFLFLDFDEPFSAAPGVSSGFAAGEGECFPFGRGDALGDGDDASFFEVEVFFFFRAGVGVGVEKTFLIALPIVCSAWTGAENETIRNAETIIRANVTPVVMRSVRNFLKDGLIDANSGVEIFEWKIFVR